MVPEPRHSLHTMPVLPLSPAIWLFQSVLTRLVQCQLDRGEKEEFRELTPLWSTREVKYKMFTFFKIHAYEKQMHFKFQVWIKSCHSLKQFCVRSNYQSVHYFHTSHNNTEVLF